MEVQSYKSMYNSNSFGPITVIFECHYSSYTTLPFLMLQKIETLGHCQASLFLAHVTSGASISRIKDSGLPKLGQSRLKFADFICCRAAAGLL
jgi:hypothetical protein